jgi:fibronectin type III domain protein
MKLMQYRLSLFVLGAVSFVVACSQSANPTRPSPVTAAHVVEWSSLAAGSNSTMSVVSADAPAAPGNLAATVSSTTLTLTWTSSPGATSYIIEAGTGAGLANITSFNTGGPGTSFTVPNVPNGTFYVRVRARNADGTSGPSNEVTFTIGGGNSCTSPPNAPTNVTSALNEPLVTITWDAPVGGCPVESYIIIGGTFEGSNNLAEFDTGSTNRSFTANIGGVLDTGDVFGRSIAAAGLDEFYVHIVARNPRGRGPWSVPARIRRAAPPPPPPPPPANCDRLYRDARTLCFNLFAHLVSSRNMHCYPQCMQAADAYRDNGCQGGLFRPAACPTP